MSVYIIDKCERFVSQRAGCGKAASPDSVRGVRPQGVRLLDTENNLTVTFKNVKKGTYYVCLHAFNKTSEDGKKVFSPWSNLKKATVR